MESGPTLRPPTWNGSDNTWRGYRFKFESFVALKGLTDTLTGKEKDPAKRGVLFGLLATTIDEKASFAINKLAKFTTSNDGHDAWRELVTYMEDKAKARKVMLVQELFNCSQAENESAQDFLARLDTMKSDLEAAGETVSDSIMISRTCSSMLPMYESLITTTLADSSRTYEEVQAMILLHSIRVEDNNKDREKKAAEEADQNYAAYNSTFGGRRFDVREQNNFYSKGGKGGGKGKGNNNFVGKGLIYELCFELDSPSCAPDCESIPSP